MLEGDKTALATIYRAHVQSLLQYGTRFTQDTALIEDAIHDMFVDIWRNRQGLNHTTSIRPYLLTSLRNKVFKAIRAKQKRNDKSQADVFSTEESIEKQIIESEELFDRHTRLSKSLSELTDRQREIIYLRYNEGLSYEEICTTLNISYQSARNAASEAIKKLRAHWMFIGTTIFLGITTVQTLAIGLI